MQKMGTVEERDVERAVVGEPDAVHVPVVCRGVVDERQPLKLPDEHLQQLLV